MRPRQLSLDALRQALRDRPVAAAADLAAQLQVSLPTVSRGLDSLGER